MYTAKKHIHVIQYCQNDERVAIDYRMENNSSPMVIINYNLKNNISTYVNLCTIKIKLGLKRFIIGEYDDLSILVLRPSKVHPVPVPVGPTRGTKYVRLPPPPESNKKKKTIFQNYSINHTPYFIMVASILNSKRYTYLYAYFNFEAKIILFT